MHRFLKAWRRQGKGREFSARIVNYADDFVILSRGHAAQALEWTRGAMRKLAKESDVEKLTPHGWKKHFAAEVAAQRDSILARLAAAN